MCRPTLAVAGLQLRSMAAAQRVKELLGGYQQRNDTKMWELQIQWAGATTIVPPMLLSDGGVAEPAPFDLVGRGSAGWGKPLVDFGSSVEQARCLSSAKTSRFPTCILQLMFCQVTPVCPAHTLSTIARLFRLHFARQSASRVSAWRALPQTNSMHSRILTYSMHNDMQWNQSCNTCHMQTCL